MSLGRPAPAKPGDLAGATVEAMARALELGTRIALVLLVLGFGLYLLGAPGTWVPIDRLPAWWGLPVSQWPAGTGGATPGTWGRGLGTGALTCLPAIAALPLCSAWALCACLRAYLRHGDRLYAILGLLELGLMAAAACGLLAIAA